MPGGGLPLRGGTAVCMKDAVAVAVEVSYAKCSGWVKQRSFGTRDLRINVASALELDSRAKHEAPVHMKSHGFGRA